VYAKLAEHNLLIFTHPHYGVGNYDPKYGHILPLAFGFTFETTQRIGEMIISGMLDRFDHNL
jgi:aminocarboxymuconate-semialdehyde decarboxylase